MNVCYIVGILIVNSWERVSRDVFKNLDLNNKKNTYIKCNVIVSGGFNKMK